MIKEKFELEYKRLNKAQKQAVDAIEGPVMVIAGPGTGKTSILTLRIANILKKTDTTPDSILALTFTKSGAYSMRKKLADIIGSSAYKVGIFTFHSFCEDIIKNYPEEFPRIIGANSITDIDQIKILEKIIDDTKLEILKPYGDVYHYVRPIISEIDNLKKENIDPVKLEKILKKQEKEFSEIEDLYHDKGKYKGEMKGEYKKLEKDIEKNKELQKIYTKYEKALEKERLYDYQDMILEVIKAFESNRDLLLTLQERYQYVLADEHQDANNSQNKILELISGFHEDPNLFIVGDEKQAIFRFQGASLENFLYFKKMYPKALVINLEENYRSTQTILDASHSLIEKNENGGELRTKLKSNSKHGEIPISLNVFEKAQNELRFIAEDIKGKVKNGVNPNEIAVLYRENKDAQNISRSLEKAGIPFAIESDQELFSDNDISKLVLLMKAINDLGNDEILSSALFIDFLNVNYVDLYKILAFSKKNKISVLDAIHKKKYLDEAKVEDKDGINFLYEKLESSARFAKNVGLMDFVERLINEYGFLNHIMSKKDSVDKLAKLERLFEQMKDLIGSHKNYRLEDFMSFLEVLDKHNVSVKSDGKTLSSGAVHLMTAHKSKGLEFDFVYVANVVDGHWGNKREMRKFKLPLYNVVSENFDAIDDERRLFYVALTRARKGVCLSYSKSSETGKPLLPSQFINEIDLSFIENKETKKIEGNFEKNRTQDFIPAETKQNDMKDKEYLRKLFIEQGLSVTALNNYLECPWRYFFSNLVRIPQVPTKHQAYGTSVHNTLKHFFDKYKTDKDLGKKEFLSLFEKYLLKQPINKKDFEDTLKKGRESLGGYFDFYKGKWVRSTVNEFSVAGVFVDFSEKLFGEGKILLKGNIDKIEIMPDGIVNVVDYKTKQPVSRNEIEGKTKNSNGNLKRQLIFYKILLEGMSDSNYKMETGEIDFIEPDDRGKYKKEKFFISEDDVKIVKDEIVKVSKEILEFSFWDKACDDKDCKYCKLRKMMKL